MTPELIEMLLHEGITLYEAYRTAGLPNENALACTIADCRQRFTSGNDALAAAVAAHRARKATGAAPQPKGA